MNETPGVISISDKVLLCKLFGDKYNKGDATVTINAFLETSIDILMAENKRQREFL